MESIVSVRGVLPLLLALACLAPAAARAQAPAPAAPSAPVTPADQSRLWIVAGGTSTTMRGDCQEDCELAGTGAYLHTGSVIATVGARVNSQMDAGVELSWVPATSKSGDDIRTTFVLGVVEFRPWTGKALFFRGGMGMAFVRNFFGDVGSDSLTEKALGLTYGMGWTFRHTERFGVKVFGAQHMMGVGDFVVGGVPVENVVANYWSVGAALVFRK